MSYDKIKYNNEYNKQKYARLSVLVPKEDRDEIDTHWKSKGFKSFNSYVIELIRRDMEGGNISISAQNIVSQTGDNNTVNIG